MAVVVASQPSMGLTAGNSTGRIISSTDMMICMEVAGTTKVTHTELEGISTVGIPLKSM